jgi:hypothetical protein
MTLMTTPTLWNLIAGRSSSTSNGSNTFSGIPLPSTGGTSGIKWNSQDYNNRTHTWNPSSTATTPYHSYVRIPRGRDDMHSDVVITTPWRVWESSIVNTPNHHFTSSIKNSRKFPPKPVVRMLAESGVSKQPRRKKMVWGFLDETNRDKTNMSIKYGLNGNKREMNG